MRGRLLAGTVLLTVVCSARADDYVLGIGVALKEYCNADAGMCVTWVRRDGAAGRAGMQAGDVLLRLGDSPISGLADVGARLRSAPPNLALDAQVLRQGLIVDLHISFGASDKAGSPSNQMLAPTPTQRNFDLLPAVDAGTARQLAAGLQDRGTHVWQDHEILTFVHRSASTAIQVIGSMQAPLDHIAGTDIWIVRLKKPSWDEAFFSYSIIEDGKEEPGESGYFRGDRAPELALEAAHLRGEVREETIHSGILEEDRHVTVYLPPMRPRSLPMLLMADGQACREFAGVAEPLILAGKVRPFAIIGVHASTGVPDPEKDRRSKEYLPLLDPAVAERHLRFVIQEVLPWATRKFHLSNERSDRAITGFSNGAAFTIYAALAHGELFADALPFSATYDGSNRDGSDPEPPASLPRFHFAAGKLEPPMEFMTTRASSRVQAWGGSSELKIYDSGHDMLMWKRALADFLPDVFPPHK